MSSVLRIYSQIYLKLLQTKKTRAFYVFIKVYLYEQTEKRSGHCLPLRLYHYFDETIAASHIGANVVKPFHKNTLSPSANVKVVGILLYPCFNVKG